MRHDIRGWVTYRALAAAQSLDDVHELTVLVFKHFGGPQRAAHVHPLAGVGDGDKAALNVTGVSTAMTEATNARVEAMQAALTCVRAARRAALRDSEHGIGGRC